MCGGQTQFPLGMVFTSDFQLIDSAKLAIIISYAPSKSRIIVSLKAINKYCQIFSDFALQEQPADHFMVPISPAWYNGSYTMAAKPIKSLDLHYTMIQFFIISYILLESLLFVTLVTFAHFEGI